MNYFTAASYEKMERVGEPYYNEKAKLVTRVKCSCPRCGGAGIIVSRVENGHMIPIPVDGGICYQCNGKKVITKEVRLYTEEERKAMDIKNQRAAEKKAAERAAKIKAEYADNKAKWLSDNGFNADGITYVITGDSYSIKSELKEAGFRYNPVLRWHAGSPLGYEDRVIAVTVDEVVRFSAWGRGEWLESAKTDIANRLAALVEPSNSIYIGEIKERLRNIPVKCTRIYDFEGRYGMTTVFTFEDVDGNVFTWFSSSCQTCDEGDLLFLTGTVKDHKEYNNVKQTVLTRCILKERV